MSGLRGLTWAASVAALVASGGYVLVYVYRWEWHRALLVGLLFLAALSGLGTALVLRRVERLERRLRAAADPARTDVLQRLRSAPVEGPPFRWLRPDQLTGAHIFIPVLIGGGVLVSGLAWLVERIAGAGARAGVEVELAAQLADVAFPRAPLVPGPGEALAGTSPGDDPALRLLLGPSGGRAA